MDSNTTDYRIFFFSALVLLAVYGRKLARIFLNIRSKKSAIKKIRLIVKQHEEVLARKRYQMVKVDDYGVIDESSWQREILYFVNKLVFPKLSISETNSILNDINEIIDEEINEYIKPLSDSIKGELQFNEKMSPIDFEYYVATLFEKSGWSAEVSKASGDQGADVIAEKGGRRVVAQCKLYGKPVGNKAVQEIAAAKIYYDANHAFVVSNNSFTPSARRLAASANVSLLHFSEIESELGRLSKIRSTSRDKGAVNQTQSS